MFKKALFSFPVIMLFVVYAYSQEIPAYDFLRIDPSARASALAGAFDMYADDPNIIFYNPSGLSTITEKKVSAGYGKYLLDIKAGSISYAMPYKNLGWFGAGIKYFNYGTFDYADENGITSGTFGASDVMLSVGYSNIVYDRINYGFTVKYIYSKIAEYNSSAYAIDFGLLYQLPDDQINLSFTVNNLGGQIKSYIDTKEKLPLDIRVGISKKLEHLPLRLSVSLANLNADKAKIIQRFKDFSIGGEFSFSDNIALRIGYSNEKRQDLKLGTSIGIAGFSAGLGIKFLNKYQFDYSLNSFGRVGSAHKFNVGYTFK